MKSHSWSAAKAPPASRGITAAATRSVSAGSTVSNGASRSRPSTRRRGREPTLTWTSEAPCSTAKRSNPSRSNTMPPNPCIGPRRAARLKVPAAQLRTRHRAPGSIYAPAMTATSPSSTPPPLRIVQWTTGNVGRRSVIAAAANPGLELVGCYAWGPEQGRARRG